MHKVYVVLGGVEYEGVDTDTVQLFISHEAAKMYGQDLVRLDQFDFYVIEERDFCTE